MNRCTVCGGDIKNGRCQSCGMNYEANKNPIQTDNTYYQQTQSQQPTQNQNRFGENTKKQTTRGKKSFTSIIIFIILTVIVNIGSDVFSNLTGGNEEYNGGNDFGAWYTGDEDEEIVNDDEFIQEEGVFDDLFADEEVETGENPLTQGEDYEVVLTTGNYIVGIHIPAGEYDITPELLNDDDSYYVSIRQMNEEEYVYEYHYLDAFDDEIRSIVFNEGDVISFDTEHSLKFVSDNAQPMTQTQTPNHLTKSVNINGGQSYIAGIDFPAGTYDIIVNSGGSEDSYFWVDFEVSSHSSYSSEFETSFYITNEMPDGYMIKNVEILTGFRVAIADGYSEDATAFTAQLIPSEYDLMLNRHSEEKKYYDLNMQIHDNMQ